MGNAGGKPADAGVLGGPEQLFLDLLLLRDVLKDQYVPCWAPVSLLTYPFRMIWGSKFRRQVISPSLIMAGEQTRLKAREQSTASLPRASDFSAPVIISMEVFQ